MIDASRRDLALEALRWFCSNHINTLLGFYSSDPSAGELCPLAVKEKVLKVVQEAISSVPAYKNLIAAQNLTADSVTEFDAFAQHFPYIDKKNFVNIYSLKDRCLHGSLSKLDFMHFSSGSVIQHLAPQFDQTVILGYPPFLKGVIDSGISQGIPWPTYNLKMVFAGEVFSEEWRSLIATRAGISDPLTSLVSIFGTADAGVLACETPVSARIRKWVSERPGIARKLFGKDRLPSLMQYDPMSRYMETHREEGTLVFTSITGDFNGTTISTTAPLIRYSIGDAGGLISYADMMNTLKELSGGEFDPVAETLKATDRGHRKMPFVYVFGRAFWTVSLYGANVYVENVMVGVEQPEINKSITGKFVLAVKEDENGDARLAVILELAPGVEPSDKLRIQIVKVILRELLRLNLEYGHYIPVEKREPLITLLPFGDPTRFPKGVKHRYIQE
ncbi:hypothetical protein HDV05_006688 [Chytridiales sp. JEL 0842]|nr:hypothetical protein HDV05_006688 [Chytridiales sp. JEL 0842]